MNTETACGAKETKLSELMQNIIDMIEDLGDAKNRLNNLSDRLFGCIPENACKSDKPPERDGAIGLLEDKLENLRYQVKETLDAVNRITDAGIA